MSKFLIDYWGLLSSAMYIAQSLHKTGMSDCNSFCYTLKVNLCSEEFLLFFSAFVI